MNQTPKFTEEWFHLKEEEIALRSYLAWCNESSANIATTVPKSPKQVPQLM
jgi:hypothetical protein